jgi:hypothetical protein
MLLVTHVNSNLLLVTQHDDDVPIIITTTTSTTTAAAASTAATPAPVNSGGPFHFSFDAVPSIFDVILCPSRKRLRNL